MSLLGKCVSATHVKLYMCVHPCKRTCTHSPSMQVAQFPPRRPRPACMCPTPLPACPCVCAGLQEAITPSVQASTCSLSCSKWFPRGSSWGPKAMTLQLGDYIDLAGPDMHNRADIRDGAAPGPVGRPEKAACQCVTRPLAPHVTSPQTRDAALTHCIVSLPTLLF
jgi:hypothetical protein